MQELESLDALTLYLKDISQFHLLSKKEEVELFTQFRQGDNKAKETIIYSNLNLVISIAKKYSNGNSELLLDYIQSGTIGLIKAIDKFDITKGYKFSTYATDWIYKYIMDYHDTCLYEIKKTSQFKLNRFKIKQAFKSLQEQLYRDPTDEEIAACCGLEVDTIQKIKLCDEKFLSLDYDSDAVYNVKDSSLSVEEIAINGVIRDMLDSVLTEEERRLIYYRFGLGEQKNHTQTETGKLFGLTKQRMNQKEKIILKKLSDNRIFRGMI